MQEKSFPNSDTLSHEEVWYFPFTPPPPLRILWSLSALLLCSRNKAPALSEKLGGGISRAVDPCLEPLIGLRPRQRAMCIARANLAPLRLEPSPDRVLLHSGYPQRARSCNDLNGPPVFEEMVTWLALTAEASRALKWTNLSCSMLERTFLLRVLIECGPWSRSRLPPAWSPLRSRRVGSAVSAAK